MMTLPAADPPGLVYGSLRRQVWWDVLSGSIPGLTNDVRYPNAPDLDTTITLFETPSNIAERYGQRVSGFIIPPTTGNYTFYISSDDQSILYLSTDNSPANKVRICSEPEWNESRAWTTPDRRPAGDNISAPISLIASQLYYIEALMAEGAGGDCLGVTWRKPGDPVPTAGAAPIPGTYLAYLQPPALPSITEDPEDQTVVAGNPATFTVSAAGTAPLSYQWLFNDAPIPGAIADIFTLSHTALEHTGPYTVVVSNASGAVTSLVARLTVLPCAGLPSGLVGWWPGDGNAKDVINANHGAFQFGALTAPGLVNQAFSFDGIFQYVDLPTEAFAALDSSFTFELWIRPDSLVNNPAVFEKGYQILNRLGLQAYADGSIGGYFDSGSHSVITPPGKILVGSFSHVAFVLDGTANLALIYVNGALAASGTETRVPLGNALELVLGRSPTFPAGYNYRGLIDEFSYYDRPLSAAEIESIYLAGAAGKCASMSVPTILVQPSSQAVASGSPAEFYVQAAGIPIPSFQWYRHGILLPGETSTTLTLDPVQSSDAGSYTVVVNNPLGRVTSQSVTLTVQSAPTLTLHPQETTIPVGADLSLSALAAGSNPLAYQWQFEGVNIPGAIGSSFFLSNAQESDAGGYRVRVSNAFGTTNSDTAMVRVLVPPGIAVPPTGANVDVGGTVHLCVTATGSAPLRYQWRKNDVNIPGATSACFDIDPVVASSGGSYSVVIANDVGLSATDPVSVTVNLPVLAAGDDFSNRVAMFESSVRGSNVGASKEPGEPNHAGQSGGRSVWYNRVAGASGIATIRTGGSAFDTLLAVYVGQSVDQLTLVAADEDQDGFLASQVRFQATTGVEYQIAVDGFDGAAGEFILSWELESTEDALPIITMQPASRTVALGGTAAFEVAATGNGLVFQWLFNGGELAGETNPQLTIPAVGGAQVGQYRVRITNNQGRSVTSQVAVLEIGPYANLQSQDKVSNPTFMANPDPLTHGKTGGKPAAATSDNSFMLGAGVVVPQIMNTTNSFRQSGEPNHCGRLGGSTRWMTFRPAVAGLQLRVDTQGSAIDTIVALYSRASILEPLVEVDCASGMASKDGFSVPAFPNLQYWVAVDGVDGAQGEIHLNTSLGTPPVLTGPPLNATLGLGENIVWQAPVSDGFPASQYQWLFNHGEINGATSASFVLDAIRADQAGIYSVRVSNISGMIEAPVATLTVDPAHRVTVTSQFNINAEQWQVVNDGLTDDPTHQAAGGAPGGHVRYADAAHPDGWRWKAPAKFLGNQSAAYGGWLKFQMSKTPTAQNNFSAGLILQSAAGVLVHELPAAPGQDWTTFEIPLIETGGWTKQTGSEAGEAPSQSEMLRALSMVEQWLIRGGFSSEPHSSALDNVQLICPVETDTAVLTARFQSGVGVLLEWAETASAFQLESAASPEAGGTLHWTPVSTVPTVTSAGLKQVQINSALATPFFRLRKFGSQDAL